ncbi:MAG: substrate-binding domain-containing protein, partial [Pseudomonadales bacterium]|nr:substrate-binding domain-containing protein [Pseudomonadales bacterium]
AKRLSPGDEVIVLEGTRTSFNAQQRLLGFQEAMLTAGATIVDKQSANWEMTPANTITTAMLTANPDVRAILAANDNMALGAMAAVRAAGRDAKGKGKDQILIVGFDNITAVQQAIQAGKILATVDQHADQLAVFGIDFALAILASEQLPSQNHETPVDLITIANLSGD